MLYRCTNSSTSVHCYCHATLPVRLPAWEGSGQVRQRRLRPDELVAPAARTVD